MALNKVGHVLNKLWLSSMFITSIISAVFLISNIKSHVNLLDLQQQRKQAQAKLEKEADMMEREREKQRLSEYMKKTAAYPFLRKFGAPPKVDNAPPGLDAFLSDLEEQTRAKENDEKNQSIINIFLCFLPFLSLFYLKKWLLWVGGSEDNKLQGLVVK